MRDVNITATEKRRLEVNIKVIKAYLKSCRIIKREAKRDSILGVVYPALLAFAMEKACKALAYFYENKKVLRGHNLLTLVGSLDLKTQAEVFINVDVKPRHIWRMLAMNNRAFEEWRYGEEPRKNTLYFIDDYIMLEIIKHTLRILSGVLNGKNPKDIVTIPDKSQSPKRFAQFP